MSLCPHCQQEMGELREGVRLPALKARIFDAIKRAGATGIAGNDLYHLIYDHPPYSAGKSAPRQKQKRHTITSHIRQINEALEDSGVRIVNKKIADAVYRLVNTHDK